MANEIDDVDVDAAARADLRTLRMTDEIRSRLKILAASRPLIGCADECISYTVYEGLKAELADEIVLEINRQAAERAERLRALPRATPAVVEVRLTPKRRRA